MSALSQLLPPPTLGQQFSTFDTLKKNIQDWAVREKFLFEISHKDKQRVLYRCRYYKIDEANCQWRLRGNVTEEGDIKVTVLVPEHTCIAPLASRSVAATQDWLQIELPRVMEVHRGTQPHDIVNCVKVQFGECIDYKVVLRVRNRLASDSLQEHRNSFEKLPSFIQAIKATNPDTYSHLFTQNNRFIRIFICPQPSRTSFLFCRKFIALDGTFLKGRFIQTLLLATTLDANHNILLLAWAIVESENIDSWRYFLDHLTQAILEIIRQHPPITLMSDQDKGLSAAVATYEPHVIPAYRYFHLRENFTTKFSRGLIDVF